jgi:hypothetical protein
MFYSIILSALALLMSCLSATATFFETGSTLKVNGLEYWSPPHVVATVPVTSNQTVRNGLRPVVVITTNRTLSVAGMEMVMTRFKETDDVYQPGFPDGKYPMNGVQKFVSNTAIEIFLQLTEEVGKKAEAPVSVRTTPGGTVVTSFGSNISKIIPNGPYFMNAHGDLREAHRLYPDLQGAFSETITSMQDGGFSVLPANMGGQALAVAVPSRLYFQKTAVKPLAGVRFGIKDIFDIKGVKTGNGNRAWYKLYPPANKTAEAVRNLIDAGAVIVGKMKTSQFANGETATADWVDYHAPFNPRGDGYQDAGSSSAGPGAGAAAYSWLDVTLGSDTGGSIRGPAQVQGIFGNRPTHGLASLTGVMPMAPMLDTAGLLARDPTIWTAAAQVLYGKNMTLSKSYPKQILTLNFPSIIKNEFDAFHDGFLKRLAELLQLNSSNIKQIDVKKTWMASHPLTTSQSLESYMNLTYPVLISKSQLKNIRDPFFADYAKAHDGRRPFIDPSPFVRWKFGETTRATLKDELAKKNSFANWFNSKILKPDAVTCSDSLLIYPGTDANFVNRNTYLKSADMPFGFPLGLMSVMSGVPDIVVPGR